MGMQRWLSRKSDSETMSKSRHDHVDRVCIFCCRVSSTAELLLLLLSRPSQESSIARALDRVFDAAIGDLTITANRSNYVDFTLPYTDLGLATLYKNADASMWIFMEPLSSDLWFVSAGFFILLGFVIWILEHGTNEEFQGSPVQQIGTTFWFAHTNALVMNDDCQTALDVARVKGYSNVVRAIENHICLFSGWLQELYGPGFLELFVPRLLSRKV